MKDQEHFRNLIDKWKSFWMNQTQNSEQDRANYFNRAMGVDANMSYHLAKMLAKDAAHCDHPGCCCVCGHQGKCPEDGPSIVQGIDS